MHLAPAELRTVRSGDAVLRFAVLGEITFVDADLPASPNVPGADEACERLHRGVVLDGAFALERAGERLPVEARTAFHIAGGAPPHRHHVDRAARVLAFEPSGEDVSDAALRRLGLVPVSDAPARPPGWSDDRPPPGAGRIQADFAVLGAWVLTLARFGRRGGFATDFCDVAHWGTVLQGNLTVEWEDDVELLTAGDVFRCEAGPPGHRMLAAEPATIVDVTPLAALADGGRMAPWRRVGFERARSANARADGADHGRGLDLARVG